MQTGDPLRLLAHLCQTAVFSSILKTTTVFEPWFSKKIAGDQGEFALHRLCCNQSQFAGFPHRA